MASIQGWEDIGSGLGSIFGDKYKGIGEGVGGLLDQFLQKPKKAPIVPLPPTQSVYEVGPLGIPRPWLVGGLVVGGVLLVVLLARK